MTPNSIDNTTDVIANPVVPPVGHTSQDTTDRTSMEQRPATSASGRGRSGDDEGFRISARCRKCLRKGTTKILSSDKEPVVGSATGSLRIKAARSSVVAQIHTVYIGNLMKSTTTDNMVDMNINQMANVMALSHRNSDIASFYVSTDGQTSIDRIFEPNTSPAGTKIRHYLSQYKRSHNHSTNDKHRR